MSQWTRAELEAAFAQYLSTVDRAIAAGDWGLFADMFTEDAVYIEHLFGTFHGREEIRTWIRKTMGSFPGSVMTGFPPSWSVIDEERGRIICELENHMPDLGDAVVRQATNITILTYAGDGLWASEEDVYNPSKFADLVTDWVKRADELGRLPDEGRAFLR
jgi:hypothetical protein